MQTQEHTQLEHSIKKGLANSQLPLFDDYLFHKITHRIVLEKELRNLKPKLWAALGVFLGSLVLLFSAVNVSWHAFAQTGTFQYASLMFTDFKVVLANWQDYSFSILETLPLGAMVFLLGSFLASLFIFNFSFRQLSNFRKLKA